MNAATLPAPAVRKARSLAPKEHGAYGQLFVPMLAALLAAWPTAASFALATAVSAVFFAHEPLLVLLGQRGVRAKSEAGERARRRLGQLGLLAAAAGLTGLALTPSPALPFVGLSVVLGAAVAGLVHRRLEKTLGGELLASSALASTAVPIALAAGVTRSEALVEWGVWTALFATATFSVHAVIARTRRESWRLLELASLAVGLLALVGAWIFFTPAVALAVAPALVLATTVAVLRPHARALRTLGWGTLAACVATLLVLVLGVR